VAWTKFGHSNFGVDSTTTTRTAAERWVGTTATTETGRIPFGSDRRLGANFRPAYSEVHELPSTRIYAATTDAQATSTAAGRSTWMDQGPGKRCIQPLGSRRRPRSTSARSIATSRRHPEATVDAASILHAQRSDDLLGRLELDERASAISVAAELCEPIPEGGCQELRENILQRDLWPIVHQPGSGYPTRTAAH